MTGITPPPLYDPVVDQSGVASVSWTLFFNKLFQGDTGTEWTPTFQNLTVSGTPEITGRYYRINRNIVYFRVTIVPETSTSSTAGTTYIDNFPLSLRGDGICFSVTSGVGSIAGHVDLASGRIFTPSWTTVPNTISIIGMVEAQ